MNHTPNIIYELSTGYMYEVKVKEPIRGQFVTYYSMLEYCVTKYDPVINIRNVKYK